MNIADTIALVTGAASGLGRETALTLAARGATVLATDIVEPDLDHPQVVPVAMDVTDEGAVIDALDRVDRHGELRIVVNCAGVVTGGRVVGRDGPSELESFVRCVTVNLVGTFNVIRLAAHRMLRTVTDAEERGVIVNTASIAAFDGQIGQAAYAASKAGVAGLTLPVARELAAMRVRCVTIAPGMFSTPMLDELPPAIRERLAANVPHPSRFGTAAEFAALVCHVLENPMLNGTTIRLDGALRMPPS